MPDAVLALERLDAALVELASRTYGGARRTYIAALRDQARLYLGGGSSLALTRSAAIDAMVEAYLTAGRMGFEAGAGGPAEMDAEDTQAVDREIEDEGNHIGRLWDDLQEFKQSIAPRLLRRIPDEFIGRIEQFGASLDAVYNELKLRGAGAKMLTFTGDDGQESCATCQRLKGQRHRASWWVRHGLVPKPGNANFECQGWNCQHYLVDDEGNPFTYEP